MIIRNDGLKSQGLSKITDPNPSQHLTSDGSHPSWSGYTTPDRSTATDSDGNSIVESFDNNTLGVFAKRLELETGEKAHYIRMDMGRVPYDPYDKPINMTKVEEELEFSNNKFQLVEESIFNSYLKFLRFNSIKDYQYVKSQVV